MKEEIAKAISILNGCEKEKNEILSEITQIKVNEINVLVNPLKDQIERHLFGINLRYDESVKKQTESINTKIKEAKNILDDLYYNYSIGLGYQNGTILHHWHKKSFSSKELTKSGETAVYIVYDDNVKIKQLKHSYDKVKKGDIILVKNRLDGSMGVRFEILKRREGEFRSLINSWFAEGETPQDNLFKKIKQNEK